jgi:hypothetical protein
MTLATSEYEAVTPSVSGDNENTMQALVSPGKETSVSSQIDNFYGLIESLSGMTKIPVTVSNFVAESFSALKNVQAVLAGESKDVLHVWIMIDDWTPDVRKLVYSVQRTVMKQLGGLHFDFYVVDLPCGTRPEEMVSDIPVIFNRAEQESTPANCSE